MTRRRLLAALDTARVEEAIRAAERASAIEVRITVAGLFWGSPERVARAAFRRLGMTATRGRNGVLLMIAPWRRRVVVIADEGITAKVDPALWSAVVDRVTAAFKQQRYTEGLVAAVQTLATSLAPHFPPLPGDTNELPDAIDRGG